MTCSWLQVVQPCQVGTICLGLAALRDATVTAIIATAAPELAASPPFERALLMEILLLLSLTAGCSCYHTVCCAHLYMLT